MLDKLQAVYSRYEELCTKSEQPDFYNDPKKAAALLRENSRLEVEGRLFDIDDQDYAFVSAKGDSYYVNAKRSTKFNDELDEKAYDDEDNSDWFDSFIYEASLAVFDRAVKAKVNEVNVNEKEKSKVSFAKIKYNYEIKPLMG